MSDRPKFVTRSIILIGEQQRASASAMVANLPIDPLRPLELVAREQVKARSPDANSRMWAGPLRDMALQGYVDGRSFRDVTWHEHFKEEYLPDENLISRAELETLVKDPNTYRKWDYTPKGKRVLVGSTTELTQRGFALYNQQIILFGESIGVQFSASPNESQESRR